ncbi:MAG: hypothetical protein KIT59_10100 [Nitrosomonas sp.]|nr:hypothetical protein [Nitrosomonas sp.]
MDPERHRLDQSPRSLNIDAFFAADRSAAAVSRTVNQIELEANGKDRAGVAPTAASFPGFKNQHVVTTVSDPNPLPHARRITAKGGALDPAVAGWKHNATYTCFFSSAARALSATAPNQSRLQVKLLFGTGSEYYRHGVCGAVESAAQPTLLIVVTGIEPQYRIEFWNPSNPAEKQMLLANNRWGVGITTASIEKAISNRYGRVISYDISVCAAFSTGYLGLQGSVTSTLFPLGGLERVIIYDCLYGTLKPALDRVKSVKGSAHIIAYVVTEGGNSFHKDQVASFNTLMLGRIPTWNYVNLMGNVEFHAVASARLVSEARSPTARILDPLPTAYETALNGLVAKLPSRNLMVSNENLFRKVKGSLPAGAFVLATFAVDKANGVAIRDFFRHVNTTRHCIGRAQLLGWPAPPGEEWHDMLLVEFAWEYLT